MLNKITRKNNRKLIVVAMCLVLTAVSLYGYMKYAGMEKELKEEPVNYNDVISMGTEEEDMYVYVEIADIPYQIAEREVNYAHIKYYILYDENGYMYVAQLSDKTYKKIEKEYEENKSDFSYTLTGSIYNIPEDLQEIIIEAFNEENDSFEMTTESYPDYFGTTYLEDRTTKYTLRTVICLIVALAGVVVSVIALQKWIKYIVNTKKTLSKLDKNELENELSRDSLKEYKKLKIYLTDKFFISTYRGLEVFSFRDIGWIYFSNMTSNLRANKVRMYAYMKNREKYTSKKMDDYHQQSFDEIVNEIADKNPNVLLGYTHENMDEYNRMSN